MSNPANRLPPEYDEMQPQDYDPQFTADISTKMRVPDRLSIINGRNATENGDMSREDLYHSDLHRTASMNVPDKIVVMGQEQSMGFRHPPELHLDFDPFPQSSSHTHVGLSTPPRVITLDDRPFPVAGDDDHKKFDDTEASFLTADDKDKSLQLQNGYVTRTPLRYQDDSLRQQALQATPGDHLLINDDEDDIVMLRRQIAKLSKHVLHLEEENTKRSQREIVLYPVVMGYILFQVARWILSK